MLTEKDYCDYDTCVALREVGCRIETEWYIHQPSYERGSCYLCFGIPRETSVLDECDYIPRLSLYEAQKWLREEKEVYVTVIPEYNDYCPVKGVKYRLEVAHWKDDEFGYETIEWLDEECSHTIITFDSYEEALSEGIKEAVKILKEK